MYLIKYLDEAARCTNLLGFEASLFARPLACPELDLPFARKNKDAKIRLLSGVSLFSACTRGELGRIASLVDQIEVPEGKILAREGDPGWEFFVVCEGRAKADERRPQDRLNWSGFLFARNVCAR